MNRPVPSGPATPANDAAKVRAWPAAFGSSINPTSEDEEPVVIATDESWLPGSEPHSPSTWDNRLKDPRNLRLAPGAAGALGLLRVGVADIGPAGLLRFSAVGEYFAAPSFPDSTVLRNARGAGGVAISYTALDFLEAYLSIGASSNSNSVTSPSLIQAFGDLTLGAKGALELIPGLRVGVDLRLAAFPGAGNQDPRRFALGFAPRALATYDLRPAFPEMPVRLHVNAGAAFDSAADLLPSGALTASEDFALQINRFNRATGGAALEFPLPVVTPFIEYTLAVPLGASGLVDSAGAPVDVISAMPQKLGLGARLTALRDISITAGAELGLTSKVALGLPAPPPYNVFVSASFTADAAGRLPTKLVETIRERKGASTASRAKATRIEGVVIDSVTKEPVQGVIVAVVGLNHPPVATAPETGRFLTHELPMGMVQLQAEKDGYKVATLDVMLERGKVEAVELVIEQAVKQARFLVSVTAASKPIGASVQLQGAKEQVLQVPENSTGPLQVDVPAGMYTVNVTAPGHLAQAREVQVSQNAELPLVFDLTPEPKHKLVVVKENRIEILQQVHFASGRATILADSGPLLAEVVHTIISGDFKKVRIEGHTDNKGNKDHNRKLSADRATAVAEWLAKAGIARTRLDPAGFGDSRPKAPNMTARGRELNRRVEFLIVER